MKIKDFMFETEDHIKLYWLLKGIDIDEYFILFNQYINLKHVPISKSLLLELFSHVDSLLRNSDWQYLETDGQFDFVYDKLLNLHSQIQEFLRKT